jgi:hypothetical protein
VLRYPSGFQGMRTGLTPSTSWTLIAVLGVALVTGTILYTFDTPKRSSPAGDVITDPDALPLTGHLPREKPISRPRSRCSTSK